MSYAAAFILAIGVEVPTMQLETVLFFRRMKSRDWHELLATNRVWGTWMYRWFIGRYLFVWSGFWELNFVWLFLKFLFIKQYLESGQYNTNAICDTILIDHCQWLCYLTYKTINDDTLVILLDWVASLMLLLTTLRYLKYFSFLTLYITNRRYLL